MGHTSGKRGFFRNAFSAMMEAREKQAHRYVASTLLMLDDETLKASGYSRSDLERRSKGAVPFVF